MTRRLNKCTDYLLKLLKTYGSERIIVCTQPEPKTKAAMAFVKTNLLIVEMDFPFSQLETLEAHLPNPMMTTADLSVIFHRALIEYELAYVEQEYAGKEDEESLKFISENRAWVGKKLMWLTENFSPFVLEPFPPDPNGVIESQMPTEAHKKAMNILQKYGLTPFKKKAELHLFLTKLAFHHIIVNKTMKEVIKIFVIEEEILPVLSPAINNHNSIIQQCIEKEGKEELIKTDEQILLIPKEYIDKLRAGIEQQCMPQLAKYKKKAIAAQPNKYINRFVKKLLRQPNDTLLSLFDFTQEGGIEHFLRLCNALDIYVRKDVIDGVIERLQARELNYTLFEEMMLKYNDDRNNKTVNIEYNLDEDDEDQEDECNENNEIVTQ